VPPICYQNLEPLAAHTIRNSQNRSKKIIINFHKVINICYDQRLGIYGYEAS
jgi:hypothetical protein